MLSSLFYIAALFVSSLAAPAVSDVQKRTISSATFDTLVTFTKYASGAYLASCPAPLGNTLVLQFSNSGTSTQGYIARDDTNRQIIVALRGSQQGQDFLTGKYLKPLVSQGIAGGKAHVHAGFLGAWNSVAAQVISTVQSQLVAHPGYSLVSTGHSLGGALSSLAGLSLKSNFPGSQVTMFTFGQPRTGDPAYAALVDSVVGVGNIFRGTHTTDGVPTIIPQLVGYKHHSTEYYITADPATAADTKQCSGDEDKTCIDSVPSQGINAAHSVYFNQNIGKDPTVCQ